jgi:putative Mn2+ efflux pump MntP
MLVKIIALVLPLSLDTFAASAALGIAGVRTRQRMRAALLFTAFEAGMPLLGLVIGRAVGNAIGPAADYVGIAVLFALAIHMMFEGDTHTEPGPSLHDRSLVASTMLGLSVSVDELAIGFTLGLSGVPLVPVIALIALQAFLAAQVGLHVGARIGAGMAERAEHVAGVVMALLATGLLIANLAG